MDNKKRQKLLKLEWDKEYRLWIHNLNFTETYLGYIFLDAIVMALLVIMPMVLIGKNFFGNSIGILLGYGYIFSHYNFFNWANNGLKAHISFKKFQNGL